MLGITRRAMVIGILALLVICLGPGYIYAAITWTPNFSSTVQDVTSVTVSWTAVTPDTGATKGSYTYLWDNATSTDISATITPSETLGGNVSSLFVNETLTDGTWYFHARAVDSLGNWTSTQHYGPVTIATAPTVTKIEPATGVNSSDTVNVTITGTNFITGATAKIGTTSLSNVEVDSSTSISATYAIKDKTADAYDITVTTSNGTSEPLADSFTVTNPAPTITAISPISAGNSVEKSVTITGTGFLSTSTTPAGTANPTVLMRESGNTSNNFLLASVNVVSTTSITATVSASKTVATYDVVVTNSDGLSATGTDLYQVTAASHTITGVSPSSGTNDSPTTITITGTNFQTDGTTQVTLEASGKDSVAGTSVSVASSTSITAVIPAGQAIATYDVKVTNPDSQTATKTSGFTVENPTATVTSITPDSMANDTTKSVTLVGTNFRTGATVKIGTTAATGVTLDGTNPDTQLTCTVPAGIAAGTYDVSVTNVGADPGSKSDAFTVTAGTTTVAVTYSASDTDHVPAGVATITATFTSSQSAAPTISIGQQGSTDITDEDMTATADGKVWTYAYTVFAANAGTYIDGSATITIKSSGGTSINITTGSTFTIDTASLSSTLTYAQGSNTTGPFKAGALTITATLSSAVTAAPKIAINQPGATDITATAMTGSGTTWTYPYTITAKDGSAFVDGDATVTLTDSSDAEIAIGSGSEFEIDTTGPTVALTYAQGSTTIGMFSTGNLVITATFSEATKATPKIAVDQPGATDITATDMTGSSRVWTYTYTIHAPTEAGYADGSATVTITNGGDSASNDNAEATNNTFTFDGGAPQVSSAGYVDTTHVDVVFSETVTGADTSTNYTIDGLDISAAAAQGSNTYRLTTSTMTAGQTYTVVVSATNVTDAASNAIGSTNNSAEYTTGLLGDVNGSGTITPSDASAAFQLYLTKEWADMTSLEQFTADFNKSGSVTPADASAIFQEYLNQ